MSLIGTCGDMPAGNAVAAFAPSSFTAASSSRTPSMPRFGSTSKLPKKRSGWSLMIRWVPSLWWLVPSIALAIPWRSISERT